MKLRSFIYFLIYAVFGPLIGFVCFQVLGLFYIAVEFGLHSVLSDRSPKGSSLYFMLQTSYLIGGVPAVATGLYAAFALAKQGYSELRVALWVATLSSLIVGVFLYLMLPPNEYIVAGTFTLAVFSMIAAFFLRLAERFFRVKSFSAKN